MTIPNGDRRKKGDRRKNTALADPEERFHLLVDNVRDYAIFVMEPDGRIASWNIGVQRLLGYEEDEFIGRPFSIIFPDEDADAGAKHELELAASVGRSEDERWHVRKDGSRFWANGVVTALRDEGQHLRGFAKIMRDNTQRQLIEEERAQMLTRERLARDEAETANRIRDQFLATISHKLRSPLTAILGWVGLLLTKPASPQDTERALLSIERNAKLQATLVDNLLQLPRLIGGHVALTLEPTDVGQAVHDAVESLAPQAKAHGVSVEVQLEEAGACVSADLPRLRQILTNLLDNAIKFTPLGGSVNVRASTEDGMFAVAVKDTGKGIERDFLPHVFEPFRQADGPIGRWDGSFGLAIVRQLVESHHGTISADSDGADQGAEFIVRLPLVETHPFRMRAVISDASVSLSGLRVLVIDDDQDAREIAVAALQMAGAVASAVSNSKDGLAVVARERPHVVICDLGMPRDDGFEFIRRLRLRTADTGGRVPAIALTAYARPADRLRVLTAGFQLHVAKPFEVATLRAAVAEVVGRGSP